MSLPSFVTFLKATSIWLILVLIHVGDCDGGRVPERRTRLGNRGKFEGQARRLLQVSPEAADPPFSPFTPSSPFSNDPAFSPIPSISPPPSPSQETFTPPTTSSPTPTPTPASISPSPTPPVETVTPSTSSSPTPTPSLSPPVEASTPSASSSPTPPQSISPPPSPSKQTSPPPVTSPNPSPTSPPRPSGLQVGFYKNLCPNKNVDIEATITAKVLEHFLKDETLLAAILRMQFHDCFVHGCDASILISGPSTEKTAGPNLSVRGYEFIDALKDAAEAECPDVVSCADIIAIATKELIKLGGGPEYSVQTGRRDGRVSKSKDVNLPNPFASVQDSISAFAAKKFSPEEMVALFGGHTVGKSHCTFFQDRLYANTSIFDPNMDADLRQQLSLTCPQGTTADNFAFLDQNPQSSNKFDNSFFDQLLKGRGLIPVDQALARDPLTSDFVLQFAQNPALFNAKLASAMVKLQALGIHTANHGEIRKVCSRVN